MLGTCTCIQHVCVHVRHPCNMTHTHTHTHTGSPNQVYHVTVMPCFDKKLEASRSDFYSDLYSTRDVDCVITSRECAAFSPFLSVLCFMAHPPLFLSLPPSLPPSALSTVEVETMLEEKQVDFPSLAPLPHDQPYAHTLYGPCAHSLTCDGFNLGYCSLCLYSFQMCSHIYTYTCTYT